MGAVLGVMMVALQGVLSLSFVSPADLTEATGVRLVPFSSGNTTVLIPPDTTGVYYMPLSVLSGTRGTLVWYLRAGSAAVEATEGKAVCLGVVQDGQWTTPVVNEEPAPWPGPNNIVLYREDPDRRTGVLGAFQVVNDEGKLWALYWDQPAQGGNGAYVASSERGTRWQNLTQAPVFTEPLGLFSLLANDSGFALYQTTITEWPEKPHPDNLSGFCRVIALRSSRDLVTWSSQQIILRPDEQDPPGTEFYALRPFAYQGRYLALLLKYRADPSHPGQLSRKLMTELVVSEDGRQWTRPFRSVDWKLWSYAEPYEEKGRLVFLVSRNRALEQISYPAGRLIGVEADANGQFITQPFNVPGGPTFLDVDARNGWVDVEVLDELGRVLGGVNPCHIAATDNARTRLDWDGLSLSNMPLTVCRLRLTMHQATVYGITAPSGQ